MGPFAVFWAKSRVKLQLNELGQMSEMCNPGRHPCGNNAAVYLKHYCILVPHLSYQNLFLYTLFTQNMT